MTAARDTESVQAKVLRTTAAQGLPPKITDPVTLRRVVELLSVVEARTEAVLDKAAS